MADQRKPYQIIEDMVHQDEVVPVVLNHKDRARCCPELCRHILRWMPALSFRVVSRKVTFQYSAG